MAQQAKMAVATTKLSVFYGCVILLLLPSGLRIFLRGMGVVEPWLGHGSWMLRRVPGRRVFTHQNCPAHLALVGFESELSF